MAWKKFSLFSLFLSIAFAGEPPAMVQIQTKQATPNLRHISKDSKFTYYQNNSGELLLSSNYDVTTIIKNQPQTLYSVTKDQESVAIVITADEHFHDYLSPNKLLQIYKSSEGEKNVTKIAKGVNPKIHLKGKWISYLEPLAKKIIFIGPSDQSFAIQLFNKVSTTFRPEVAMLNENQVLYSDINEQGIQALFIFNLTDKKSEIFDRMKSPDERYELCLNKDKLFMAKLSTYQDNGNSIIGFLPTLTPEMKNFQILYNKTSQDPGLIVCSFPDQLYFIVASTDSTKGKSQTEIAKIDLANNNQFTILSNLENVSNLFMLGDRLVTMNMGKYYLVAGSIDLIGDDKLEAEK